MIAKTLSQCILLAVVILFQNGCHTLAPPPGLGRPYEKANNMTLDETILETLGGIDVAANMMMEEGSDILSELDMYLSMDQFTNMYQPPDPEDMVKMGIMPAPMGTHQDDPRTSYEMPPDFRLQTHLRRNKRKAAAWAKTWTNNEVPYLFSRGHFSEEEEYMMRRSMTEWERYTCLKFRPATQSDKNSLRFQNGQGCNSQLGMRGGVQVLNLQTPGCRFKGLYLHEIGHAVGLVHEHQLPDRDNFIRILYHNVSPHMRVWFNKYDEEKLNRMKVPYELSSIMHYGITAFSKDGESQTIEAINKQHEERIGRVYLKELAYTDVEMVNKFYGCANHCPDQTKCGSDGHLNEDCNCVCRDGSQDCDRTKQATDASCTNKYFDWPCYIWAHQGECVRNAFYMNRDCAKACGVCGDDGTGGNQGPCKDVRPESKCKVWKERGDCVTNPKWMEKHCVATCKMCPGTGVRPEENCQNKNTDGDKCDGWALDGECSVNKAWMFENCRKSCHMCADDGTDTGGTDGGIDEGDLKCENTHDMCETWASNGECNNNPPWMVANCRKACDKCDDGKCKNLYVDVRCEIWAQKKECMANSKWMGKNCAKSCSTGPCKGKDPSETTTAGPGTMSTGGGRTTRPTPSTTEAGTCVNTHDSDTQCDVWAKAGHCEINPTWMLKHCALSCGRYGNSGRCGGSVSTKSTSTTEATDGDKTTNVCHDDNELCRTWAEGGHCDGGSSVYMLKNCKKSCNNCNGCRDAEFMCSIWAKADFCLQNPRYMMRHCQKSCHACTISSAALEDQKRPDHNAGSQDRMNRLVWTLCVTFLYVFFQK